VSGRARLRSASLFFVVVATAACVSGPSTPAVVSPSLSAVPTSTASPEPTVSTPAPSPSAIASPQRTPDRSAPVVRANAIGRLTGNWIFVGKQVPYAHHVSAEVQIWAIPLDGGAPRLAFAYDVSTGGAPEAIFDNTPYLRRQFSPDGTRVVVSVGGQLETVDLPTGRVTSVGVEGYYPAWSKDGSRIAFLYYLPVDQVVPPEEAIGVIAATGGPVTQLAKVGYSRQSVEWSPEGSMLVVTQPDQTVIVDATNGKVLRRISEGATPSAPFAHWRSATPQVAIAHGVCGPGSTVPSKVVGFDDLNAPEQTLVGGRQTCEELTFRDPRWNPTGAAELLYVAAFAPTGEYRPHIVAVPSGRDTALPFLAYEATWTWDGAEIVYIAQPAQLRGGPMLGGSDLVFVSRRDGTGTRSLLTATEADAFFFSVASVSY